MENKLLILIFIMLISFTSSYSTTATISFEIEESNYIYVEGQPVSESYNIVVNNNSNEISVIKNFFNKLKEFHERYTNPDLHKIKSIHLNT